MRQNIDLGPYSVLIESQLSDWQWDRKQIERQLRGERRDPRFGFKKNAAEYNAYRAEAIDYAVAEGLSFPQAEKSFDIAVDARPQAVVEDFEKWSRVRDETALGVVRVSQTVVIEPIG